MRIRMSVRPLMVAAATIGAAFAFASSASAAAPTGAYAPFKYCPYSNTAVETCLLSQNTAGTFQLGNATVPIPSGTTLTLQGGFSLNSAGTGYDFFNAANGGATLPATPLKVPGGLIGLVNTGGWSGVLIDLFNAAVASVNDVYSTAELAGPVQFNFVNFLIGFGDAVVLPLKVHLTNPFLGSSCYIGSNSNPINLHLTTGTTSPPAPNTPVSGSTGVPASVPGTSITTTTGLKLVDNAFAVPAASNCGYLLLDKLIITAGVNLKEGLPSAAGKNSVVLQGSSSIAARSDVAASVH
jgi:hypothetical protein